MNNPEKILIDSDEPSVDELDQYYTVVEWGKKLQILLDLLVKEKPASAIVFCKTRMETKQLARELKRNYLNAVPLHGDLSQSQREFYMNLFRSGRADILVATDVASRGIDIRHVDCVINYEVPHNPLLYFHRVGRTARAGDKGKSYTLVSKGEFQDFARICTSTQVPIKPQKPEDKEYNFYDSHFVNKKQSIDYRPKRSFGRSRYRKKKWYT